MCKRHWPSWRHSSSLQAWGAASPTRSSVAAQNTADTAPRCVLKFRKKLLLTTWTKHFLGCEKRALSLLVRRWLEKISPALSMRIGCPDFLAASIGVSPLELVAQRSALCWSKQLKHRTWPCSVAKCEGVLKLSEKEVLNNVESWYKTDILVRISAENFSFAYSLSFAFGFVPASSNQWSDFKEPNIAACKGTNSLYKLQVCFWKKTTWCHESQRLPSFQTYDVSRGSSFAGGCFDGISLFHKVSKAIQLIVCSCAVDGKLSRSVSDSDVAVVLYQTGQTFQGCWKGQKQKRMIHKRKKASKWSCVRACSEVTFLERQYLPPCWAA